MFQEAAEIKRRNAKLSDYYENLRTNVFSILGKQLYFIIFPTSLCWLLSRSEARDESSWHGQPGEVRQLPDQAPEHLHWAGGRGGDCQARHGIFKICSAEHLCSSNSNTHMSVVTMQCYIEFFLLKWKLEISIGKLQYNWFNFLDVTDLCDIIILIDHFYTTSL